MKKFILSLGLLAFAISATPSAHAQTANTGIIEVVGTASLELKPDEVYITVGVSRQDEAASAAMQAVQKTVAQVLSGLKANKQIKELNTEYVSLQRQGVYNNEARGFMAHQNISFVLTDLTQYDAVLLELLAQGINQLGNIQFRSSIAEKQQEKLMAAALQNAKTKATAMAAQYQQQVGKAIRISDASAGNNNPEPMMYKSFAEDANMSSIVGGNLKLEVQVFVQFELN